MQPTNRKAETGVTKSDLEQLSDFRYRLRQFLHFSERILHDAGLTPLQYMLMLHTCAFPDRSWATVGEIAERLQASSHGTVALVTRCEAAGLVTRHASLHDRRQVEIHLTPKGESCLRTVATLHKSEIRSFGWAFQDVTAPNA
ncbi:MarR family transcriptional regulator [Burkholderia sp. Bp8963]|uniref:MarR family winged helix-turn-helix transcriptional regulator n=1 Tax=Burkholderia sp. Bp8963 TaxID=2184547 RepID=UPI000F5B76D3|nr:MarR family winged helix-turn-helix transcriptional regulator [Burkholderia sp. Bp8963]RQS76968.1 MarR family transcriptional regulator [Burkholderia sp. Bp8963]